MLIQYYGHSCFGVEIGGKRLLFDPFISGNPLAQKIDIESIRADYILISHGHADHVSDVERIAKRTNALLISTYEIITWFENKGLQGIPMNTGGKKSFEFGTVKLVAAVHSSALPDGSYAANPVGFCVYNEEISFYFAGDTALTKDMQLIPMTCPPLQFAFLPIGDHFTMGYEDAIIASDFLNCPNIVACHFDTFSPIVVNHEIVQKAFSLQGKHIKTPSVNEIFHI